MITLNESLEKYVKLQKEHNKLLDEYNTLIKEHIRVMNESIADKKKIMFLNARMNSSPSLN